VKELEAVRGLALEVVLDTWLPTEHGGDLFELAVSFTATSLVEYYRRGMEVRLLIVGPEPVARSAAPGVRPLEPLLRELALVEAELENDTGASGEGADDLVAVFTHERGWGHRLVVTVGRGERLHTKVGPGTHVVDVTSASFGELFEPHGDLCEPEKGA